MTKRLWKVSVEHTVRFDMVVVAEDPNGARAVAEEFAGEAEDDLWFDPTEWYAGIPSEVTDPADLDPDELGDDPYGESGGRTVGEWLAGEVDGTVEHAVPFCGGTWRLNDPVLTCDNCGAQARATLANLDAAWADNDARRERSA